MEKDELMKKCDSCAMFLNVSCFYRNKSKSDGYQNKCIDCVKDYKIKKKQGILQTQEKIKKEFYFIPDIFIVGYGRMQSYQNCCLICNSAFFCLKSDRDFYDLYCEDCENPDLKVPEKNISNVNYVGNVVGWMAKTESPSRIRRHKNYKKVYERDKYTCQYCGYNLKNCNEFLPLHIDHIKPFSCNGGNAMTNMVVSCQECNLLAHDKWFSSFEEKKDFILFQKESRMFLKSRKEKRAEDFMKQTGQIKLENATEAICDDI